ncbi:hypothetical protein O3G_MSEX000460 [Manduca sexta]|nr:hypothetical protein O3G_MSEX000460 [Manduca sexta]
MDSEQNGYVTLQRGSKLNTSDLYESFGAEDNSMEIHSDHNNTAVNILDKSECMFEASFCEDEMSKIKQKLEERNTLLDYANLKLLKLSLENERLQKIIVELKAENKLLKDTPNVKIANTDKVCEAEELSSTRKHISIENHSVNTLLNNNEKCSQTLLSDAKQNPVDLDKNKIIKNNDDLKYIQNTLSDTKKIFIVGGTQCQGLATELIRTRHNSMYDKYKIQGLTFPGANTEVLSETCEILKLTKNDKLVLCVGEEDSDPYKIVHELYNILKRTKANVVLLPVTNNRHLNVNNINRSIHCVSNKFNNCKFLQCHNYHYRYQYSYIKYISSKINYIIDIIDYNTKFIPSKNKTNNSGTKKLKASNVNHSHSALRQKTITEYFNVTNRNNRDGALRDIRKRDCGNFFRL